MTDKSIKAIEESIRIKELRIEEMKAATKRDKTKTKDLLSMKMLGIGVLGAITIVCLIFNPSEVKTVATPCITGIAGLVGASLGK